MFLPAEEGRKAGIMLEKNREQIVVLESRGRLWRLTVRKDGQGNKMRKLCQ